MSIFIDSGTKVLVQGITGSEGRFHTRQCLAYGTRIVAGVTPGKGGGKMDDVPVFNTVDQAVEATGADASMVFVPPAFCADAVMEAADAGIKMIVAITEGIPILDMVKVRHFLSNKDCRLIGPNCPGIITPGECKIGIMPGNIHARGHIGVVSRSGTLTYEVVDQLTKQGLGQSTCIGIGGDPVNGTGFIDVLAAFQADDETRGIVMVGEIGGSAEEEAAAYIKKNLTKPVVGFIAGLTAPPGRRMGHAGAIISGSGGTGEAKIAAFKQNGIHVCENLGRIGQVCKDHF
ncbi:MAG: succinate--CoA ligase subunit alpha [Desulfobacterales bacterium]|nr:succinate--CoA ligase subunit alpha [Desulfobacterales bacterium]